MLRKTLYKITPLIIAIGLFMETIDSTIINTAIPKIAASLQINPISLKFSLTSYLISLAVFIPISGWLADKFGTKRIFAIAMFIFTLGSIFCGMSDQLYQLVLARIFQGMGGAMMTPVGRLILFRTFPKGKIINATTSTTTPALIGPAIGPVLGGFITTYFSWRWIFYVNVPIGLIGFLLIQFFLKETKIENDRAFDWLGFFLFGIGIATLSLGFDTIGETFLPLSWIIFCISFGALLLVSYYFYAKQHTHPVLDLQLFKSKTFGTTVVGGFISRLGIGGVPFLLPLLFQINFGLTPLQSGLLIVPLATGMLIMKLFIGRILKYFGFKHILMLNSLLLTFTISQFALVNPHTSYFMISLMVFIHGMIVSSQFSCVNILPFVDLTHAEMSRGTSITSTMQQLSMSFGIGISALLLSLFLHIHYDPFAINLSAFHKAFIGLGLTSLLSLPFFMRLNNTAGRKASGHLGEKPL